MGFKSDPDSLEKWNSMSFAKAEQLLDLATMVSARHQGVTLDEVFQRYAVSLRTAQRMMRALELRFPDVETWQDEEGRKRWRMPGGQLRELLSVSADELDTLELGINHLTRAGLAFEAGTLEALREKIMAMIPRQKIARIGPDFDAILEAQGFVARPGPRPRVDETVAAKIADAIKSCKFVDIAYKSNFETVPKVRQLAPYGLLSGPRRYLVAHDPESRRTGAIKTYRMDGISSVTVTDRFFIRPDDFDLQAFANQGFGLFQRDDEYGEIEWRFLPVAAEQAKGTLFHPEQTEEMQPDGSLIIRFKAAGHVEMAWYLYQWGDKVEVLKPEALKAMVADHRRGDFPAMP